MSEGNGWMVGRWAFGGESALRELQREVVPEAGPASDAGVRGEAAEPVPEEDSVAHQIQTGALHVHPQRPVLAADAGQPLLRGPDEPAGRHEGGRQHDLGRAHAALRQALRQGHGRLAEDLQGGLPEAQRDQAPHRHRGRDPRQVHPPQPKVDHPPVPLPPECSADEGDRTSLHISQEARVKDLKLEPIGD
jgi:hypothetical protein